MNQAPAFHAEDTSAVVHPGLGPTRFGGIHVRLLEGINRTGSLRLAAREIGMSYRSALNAVDTVNNLAGTPLLIRAPGGQHCEGSHLTGHGLEVVRLYRLLESGFQEQLRQLQRPTVDVGRFNELLKAIALRTSARNQFRGMVSSVRRGAIEADIKLDLGDGAEITARVTNDAVDELHLAPGRGAIALVKASLVLLSPDTGLQGNVPNRLRGTVTELSPGPVNSEVKMLLAGGVGRMLTAVLSRRRIATLGLVEGSGACALINPSHVLVAVND